MTGRASGWSWDYLPRHYITRTATHAGWSCQRIYARRLKFRIVLRDFSHLPQHANVVAPIGLRLTPFIWFHAQIVPQRGLFFDVPIAPALVGDPHSRRRWVQNVQSLCDALRGAASRAIVFSSGAEAPAQARGASDLAAVAALLGMNAAAARACTTANARALVERGALRVATHRGVAGIVVAPGAEGGQRGAHGLFGEGEAGAAPGPRDAVPQAKRRKTAA